MQTTERTAKVGEKVLALAERLKKKDVSKHL